MKSLYKKILISSLLVIFIFTTLVSAPLQARAQTVPGNTDFDFNSIMSHLKDFVLDKLAVMVANQIIQRMTASVVDWINHGFDGGPAFLTNPEGFFLDVGDQITGEFIERFGSTAVCSQFNLDIQIALALNYVNDRPRYECTLSKVIQNVQDARINVGVSQRPGGANVGDFMNPSNLLSNPDVVNLNGQSAEGYADEFMRGDFVQGGWRAYTAMTMEPKNNANGIFLQAQSDVQAQVAARKEALNTDLNRGSGFLSWEDCTDVQGNFTEGDDEFNGQYGLNNSQVSQLNRKGNQVLTASDGSRIKKTVDKKTSVTSYQKCESKTPGSILKGSLQKKLDIPDEKMVLVKTISDSIDAVLNALVNQMLAQGLSALSTKASGGNSGKSYLKLLVDESNSGNSLSAQTTRERLSSESNSLINLNNDSLAIYDEGVIALTATKTRFVAVRACYDTKIKTIATLAPADKLFAEGQMRAIDGIITTRIDPKLSSLITKKETILAENAEIRGIAASTTGDTFIENQTADDIRAEVRKLESYINNVTKSTRKATTAVTTARQEVTLINVEVTDLNKLVKAQETTCAGFPYTTTSSTGTN